MEMLQSLPLEALVPCIGSIHVCILEVIHIDLQNICIYIYNIIHTPIRKGSDHVQTSFS